MEIRIGKARKEEGTVIKDGLGYRKGIKRGAGSKP